MTPSPEELIKSIAMLDVTINLYGPSVSETILMKGLHQTLGLLVTNHPEYSNTVILKGIHPGTPAHNHVKQWQSRYHGATISMINQEAVTKSDDVHQIIAQCRRQRKQTITVQFV